MNPDRPALMQARRHADLLFLQDERVIAVIEAKGRAMPDEYYRAVLEQVRDYARLTSSRWTLLADPIAVRIFPGESVEQPIAVIPSEQVLAWADIATPEPVGESTLLLALEWWLTDQARLSQLPERFPQLAGFAHDLSECDQVLLDAAV
jgi:hypothetical protein